MKFVPLLLPDNYSEFNKIIPENGDLFLYTALHQDFIHHLLMSWIERVGMIYFAARERSIVFLAR